MQARTSTDWPRALGSGRRTTSRKVTSVSPLGRVRSSAGADIRRPEPRARSQSVDVLACITYDRALQRRAAAWQPGDVIEVEGALQRRFWRTGSGTASVCEVNCRKGRKVPRSGAAAGVQIA